MIELSVSQLYQHSVLLRFHDAEVGPLGSDMFVLSVGFEVFSLINMLCVKVTKKTAGREI